MAVLLEQNQELSVSADDLLKLLKSLNISYEIYHHEAVFTVAESDKIDLKIPGTHCRNMFLRDKKKKNFLVTLQNDTKVDLKKLPKIIESDRLSFASAERLWQYLGVKPGSVCPFSIVNDKGHDVTLILDKGMMETDIVNYHPMENTMTVSLKPQDLIKFIESTGHDVHIVDLSNAKPDEEL